MAQISDIKILAGLTNLESLTLIAQTSILNTKKLSLDLIPLKQLSKIRKLSIWYASFKNIDAITYLKELESLDLSSAEISDINFLAHLTN